MLASLVIRLQPSETYELDSSISRSIQALFYNLLDKANPELASAYHNTNFLKPFTVSPLFGAFGRSSTKRLIVKGFNYWFRCTFLGQEVFDAFTKVVFPISAENELVSLNGKMFSIQSLELEKKNQHSWSGLSSFTSIQREAEEIYLKLKSEKQLNFGLKFASPTTFRRGNINYLFPDPYLVFKSYLKKWNAFSQITLDETSILDYVVSNLVVSSYKLKTDIFDAGDVMLQGFKGFCRFSLLKFRKVETPLVLALVKFAFYAGTGQKTTMGMGMTKPEIFGG